MSSKLISWLRMVCDFLFKVRDLTFPLVLNNKKPRRSIVRYIGSILPLPAPPKLYLHLPAFQQSHELPSSSDVCSYTDDDESSKGNETPTEWSDAACAHDATIQQLQLELKMLREQVASILIKQSDKPEGEEDKKCLPPAPPPPPPPPPPLPPLLTPMSNSMSSFVTPVRPRKPLSTRNEQAHPLNDVLREMTSGRPKLKPIERSPGGRPVKPPKKATDPSDILTEVLKKRFIATHFSPDSLDSDGSSSTDVVSSEWKTCFI